MCLKKVCVISRDYFNARTLWLGSEWWSRSLRFELPSNASDFVCVVMCACVCGRGESGRQKKPAEGEKTFDNERLSFPLHVQGYPVIEESI